MQILNADPAVTAKRVHQLHAAYPLECARALKAQPEAISMAGDLAAIADDVEASFILAEALKDNPEYRRYGKTFYAADQAKRQTLPRQMTQAAKVLCLSQMIASALLA
jgi:hypothetical protein